MGKKKNNKNKKVLKSTNEVVVEDTTNENPTTTVVTTTEHSNDHSDDITDPNHLVSTLSYNLTNNNNNNTSSLGLSIDDYESTPNLLVFVENEYLARIESLKKQLQSATKAYNEMKQHQQLKNNQSTTEDNKQKTDEKATTPHRKNKLKNNKKKESTKTILGGKDTNSSNESLYSVDGSPLKGTTNTTTATIIPSTKRGYLFKWSDRSIGWSGTKWALRFVVVEKGRLAYYGNHTDTSPRYVLSLQGCAVRDDGYKRNRRHISKNSTPKTKKSILLSFFGTSARDEDEEPPLEEPGAYFFLFSIYQRPTNDDGGYEDEYDSEDDYGSDEVSRIHHSSNIVPLLTFSTPSIAEHDQWMVRIEESCNYCETDQYRLEEIHRKAEIDQQVREQQKMALAMPEAKEGTLPPLYFAPSTANTQQYGSIGKGGGHASATTQHRRIPSFTKAASKTNLVRSRSKGNLDPNNTLAEPNKADETFDKKMKGYPPSKPMHRCAEPSYLSLEAPVQNYRGFFNLGIIVLVISNIRMIVTSIRNHGFIINPRFIALYLYELPNNIMNHPDPWSDFPFVSGFLLQLLFVVLAYGVELLLSQQRLPERLGMFLHHSIAHSSLLIPIGIVWNYIKEPVDGAILLSHAAITWMKLISYFLANEDYRLSVGPIAQNTRRRRSTSVGHFMNDPNGGPPLPSTPHEAALLAMIDDLDERDMDIVYPQNITIRNLLYFWVSPTLTYQIAFPKSPRIRLWIIGDIILRMVVTFTLFTFVAAQIVQPALRGLVQELDTTGGSYTIQMLADYWLRLSIANTYLWLLMFYFYFHLYLNLLAELLRFGDRVFYKDWWNSSEVSAFWRLWNLPVHYWLIRHLYFPCIRSKMSKTASTFIVFLVSAILHEVLVSVPFHIIRPWSFIGMMGQIPLVAITKYLYRRYPGSSVGNMIFWLSFCIVGQPMAILLYTVDYNYERLQLEKAATMDASDLLEQACRVSIFDQCLIR